MSSLLEHCQKLWKSIYQSPTQLPTSIVIPRSQVNSATSIGGVFQRDAHYFQIRVNEMFLPYSREWFSEYDPMVFAVSEFTYNKKFEALPFIVGPTMMEKYGKETPTGMLFQNTRVAGPHPYKGGRLTVSIVLCRVRRRNYAKELLKFIEKVAGALDVSMTVNNYTQIGSVVLDGVEALLGLGDTDPLIGVRTEFDPDAGDILQPTYFAIIDSDKRGSKLDTTKFWVSDNQLLYGTSIREAKPFRDSSYVLYSLVQSSERSDISQLPFYPLYEQVKVEAAKPDAASWLRAKEYIKALYQTLIISPDLTSQQVGSITNNCINEMRQLHRNAIGIASLEGAVDIGEVEESRFEDILNIISNVSV